MRSKLTRAFISSQLAYNPLTGEFLRKKNRKRAGGISKNGGLTYRKISLDGDQYYEHHLAWVIEHGEWPSAYIDHKNGDGCDNRIDNLRLATPSQNRINAKASKGCLTGHRGIVRHENGKYRVVLRRNRRSVHVGYFVTVGGAIAARDKVYAEIYGQFIRYADPPMGDVP